MTTLDHNIKQRKAPCQCCTEAQRKVHQNAWFKASYLGLDDDSEAVAHDVHEQDGWDEFDRYMVRTLGLFVWLPWVHTYLTGLCDTANTGTTETSLDELVRSEFIQPFIMEGLIDGVSFSNSVPSAGAELTMDNLLEAQNAIRMGDHVDNHMVDAFRYAVGPMNDVGVAPTQTEESHLDYNLGGPHGYSGSFTIKDMRVLKGAVDPPWLLSLTAFRDRGHPAASTHAGFRLVIESAEHTAVLWDEDEQKFKARWPSLREMRMGTLARHLARPFQHLDDVERRVRDAAL